MSYADKLGIPYVIFLGEDEIAAGVVACKDMHSGEQTKLPLEETMERIRAGLAKRTGARSSWSRPAESPSNHSKI